MTFPSSFFLLPSSFFLLPSSFFLLPFLLQRCACSWKGACYRRALSRSPVPHIKAEGSETEDIISAYVDRVERSWPIATTRLYQLRAATVHDPKLQRVIGYVLNEMNEMIAMIKMIEMMEMIE